MPFLIALGTVLLLTPVVARLGRAVGLVDRPGDPLKIHRQAVPTVGGLSVVVGVAAAALVDGASWPSGGVVAAVLVALTVGTIDDARPLPPWARVGGLAVAGVVLVAATGLSSFGLGAGIGIVLLVLACANGLNILDGQDGLAGGVATVATAGFAVLTGVILGLVPPLLLALLGALIGFLVWNRPPARVFLGNGGAYAVGVLLAVPVAPLVVERGWQGLLAAGACLGTIAFEIVFTVARRVIAGRAVGSGDREHSYDLVSSRIGRGRSTLLFVVLGAAVAGFALLLARLPLAAAVPAVLLVAATAAFLGIRLWTGRPVHSSVEAGELRRSSNQRGR